MGLSDTNAGFRYTPSGGTEKEHRLNYPFTLEEEAALRTRRVVRDTWDFSGSVAFESSAGYVEEFQARLRFDANPRELLLLLDHAAGRNQIDYYPDLDIDTSYTLEVIGLENVVQVSADEDRIGHGEYEVQLRVRSADGTSLEPLYSPWLLKYEAGFSLTDFTFSRGSTGSYRAQDDTLTFASSGEPRDGHYVTDEAGNSVRAIKLEASRTNSLLDSGDLSSSNWTTSNASVAASAGGAPDGSTAYTLTDSSTGSEGFVHQDVTVAGDANDRVLSCFIVKQSAGGTFPSVDIEYRGSTAGNFNAGIIVDTTGATVQDTVGSTAQIANRGVIDWSADHVRAWVAVTNDGSTASTTIRSRFYPARSTGSGTNASATTSYDFWGAQLEGV